MGVWSGGLLTNYCLICGGGFDLLKKILESHQAI